MSRSQTLFGPSVALERAVAAVNDAGPPAGPPPREEMVRSLANVLRRFGEEGEDAELVPYAGPLEAGLALLHSVLDAPNPAAAAARINELLANRTGPLRLLQEPGAAWHLHADVDEDDPADWLVASSVMAMAIAFAEHGEPPWGRCQAAGCARFYVRGGPGRPRTTCSPACATRKRQADWRARRRAT